MVAPVRGPFTTTYRYPTSVPNRYGWPCYWVEESKRGYKQARPYDRPLDFTLTRRTLNWANSHWEYAHQASSTPMIGYDRYDKAVYNKAWERLQDEIRSEKSSILVNLAQYQQAADGIASMGKRLALGFRAAKRGNLKELKRLWSNDAGLKNRAKRGGAHVLEYSFGWAPLVSDIQSAVEVLGKGIPPVYVKGSASFAHIDTESIDYGAFSARYTANVTTKWKMGAQVQITNPNLLLAESLGLVNLGEVVWEVIPWSFVFDYFVNVSTLISSFNNEMGYTLVNPWRVKVLLVEGVRIANWDVKSPGYNAPSYGYTTLSINRMTGSIPGPKLTVRLPWKMSPQRAATSIALLLQQLR